MMKGLLKRFVLLLTIVVGCLHQHPAFAALPDELAVPGTYAHLKGDVPNTELEITHSPVHTGLHGIVHKLSGPSYLPVVAVFNTTFTAISNKRIHESSGFVKEYLFFIYPSHHFW